MHPAISAEMMIGSAPDDITTITLVTGIPQLDEALATEPGDGGVILVCGPTGGGKTILAMQMAVNSALAGRSVWALMHETGPRNFHERAYSAACDEPYGRVLRGLALQDMGTGNIRLPILAGGAAEFSSKAFNLGQKLREHLQLGSGHNLHQDPCREIKAFIEGREGMPEILIIDWLCATLDQGANIDDLHDRMDRAMKYLRRLASDHGVLVVVFCQATPKVAGACKNVFKTAVAEFPRIVDDADSFVGISQLARMPSESGEGNWSENQFLTVYPDARAETRITIPVRADFDYQRFLPRVEDDADCRAMLAAEGRLIRATSCHPGWVRFSRPLLRQLAGLGHPPSINVFVLLMLMANQKRDEVFAGRELIARATGLSDKQVRLALAKLEGAGLLKRHGKHQRANKYVVQGMDRQDDDSGFWFCLHRNLRDESRSQLFANPSLLRVWLLCLTSARYKIDTDMEVERGAFLIQPGKLAETVGITVAEFEDCLAELERQGRIAIDISACHPDVRVATITNWELYQDGWVDRGSHPVDSGDENWDEDEDPTVSGRSENGAKTGVFTRAKTGPTEGQDGAKTGPTEGQDRATK